MVDVDHEGQIQTRSGQIRIRLAAQKRPHVLQPPGLHVLFQEFQHFRLNVHAIHDSCLAHLAGYPAGEVSGPGTQVSRHLTRLQAES